MYWAGIPLLCNCINNNYYILCWRLAAILKDELPSIAVGVFLNGVAFDITHVSTKLLGGSVLCNFNVSLGNVHSGTVSLESLSYEHNTDDRDDGAETCCDKHPLGPFGHFSLSTKILLAAPFFAIGLRVILLGQCTRVDWGIGLTGIILRGGGAVGSFSLLMLIE